MDDRRIKGLMGLCVRAGQAVFGEEGCRKALTGGQCALLLLDGGISPNSRKRYEELSERTETRTELLPAGPWNYGLLPEEGFSCEELPVSGKYVFDWRTPPLRIRAKGRKIPGWKLQDHMCAPLQESPVRSGEPTEEIFLIPLGCARLRLSVFPVISDEETARVWKDVPEETDMDSRPALRI